MSSARSSARSFASSARFFASLEAFVTEAKRLREKADASEQEFLNFLLEGEKHEELWRAHFSVYDKLVETICTGSRYRNWERATQTLAPEDLSAIGVNGAVEAIKVVDPVQRGVAIEEMRLTAQEHRAPLSKQTARHIAGKYRKVVPQVFTRNEEVLRLRAENKQLKARNRELEAEIRELRKMVPAPKAKSSPRRVNVNA